MNNNQQQLFLQQQPNTKAARLRRSGAYTLLKYMRKDSLISELSEDAVDDTKATAATNRVKTMDEKGGAYIVLNLRKEPPTLVTSLIMSEATTRDL